MNSYLKLRQSKITLFAAILIQFMFFHFAYAADPPANAVHINPASVNPNTPYYLNQTGAYYVLDGDVGFVGTGFAIIASNITLDLNGHIVTYDIAPKIVIPNNSFENGANGWDLSAAPNAQVAAGVYLWNEVYDGSYSLRFSLPATNQNIISTSTVTLDPNTTYSLSAMFEYGGKGDTANPGVKAYVRLVGNGLPTREVFHADTNWRGIQLREGTFTTGPTPETYLITAGVESGSTVSPATNYFIDDIKIQRTKVYGVTAAVYDWSIANYPGCTQFGRGVNAVIKNGIIIQGTGEATWAHGVFAQELGPVTIQGLNITVHGANSSAIYGMNPGLNTFTISGNTLTSNVRTITSRDYFNGAVIYSAQGQIYGNTITNGPHAGIVTYSGIASDIHDNVIQLKTKYTNAFAIGAGHGSQIHANTINCDTGEYACRGIMSPGDPDPSLITRIFGNTIKAQNLANNQEYQGVPIGGAYGIQTENAKNIEVYGNDVYAYGNAVDAYAYRANSDEGTSTNIWVHHNTFRAIAGLAHAASVKLSDIPAGVLRFEDNTLITNDGIVGGTTGSHVTLARTHITRQTPIADPCIIETDWWPTTEVHSVLSFVDTVFEDAATKTYFENAVVRNGHRYGGSPDNRMVFTLSWTATVNVLDSLGQPVYLANVSINDFSNANVFTGQTDSNGKAFAELAQYIRSSTSAQPVIFDVKTPHNIMASSGGFTNSANITMDSAKSITLNLESTNSVPPNITTQPVNQTVTAGQTATFSVVATGTDPLAYQWQKNSVNISGATSSSYTTPATTIADNGALFACVVSNIMGSMTSSSATLTVNNPVVAPSITTQPLNQTVTAGQTASFSVTASGTSPLSYQWQNNSVNISGATSSNYTTPVTTLSDSGSTFRCVVSNSAGTATSNQATLTVNAPADTTAPVISSITNTTKATTATISWITNELSTSQVEYGLTTSYGSLSTLDTNLVISHSMTLTGLSAAKTYHFRVKSKDNAGNLAISGDAIFKTKRK